MKKSELDSSSARLDEISGFLLIDKPSDWTSHDVVASLKGISKIKKVGHAGTLDPMATGLLICGLGRGTKALGNFSALPKTYLATITLGQTSDSYDATGEITKISEETDFEKYLPAVKSWLKNLIGPQQQVPPMYSAKSINGTRLYKLARKGEEVEREPVAITIYNVELLNWQNNGLVEIKVTCSAGTYIRSLAHDLGQFLGCGGLLSALRRTEIGDFRVENAIIWPDQKSEWREHLLPL